MKIRNIICFLILIFCAVLTGCGAEKTEKDIKSVEYLNIKFEIDENLYVGDSFRLFDYTEISTNIIDPEIQFGSDDKDIINFDGTTFSCEKAGMTNIYVRGKLSDGRYVYAREKVIVENRPTYYTSFSLQKSIVMVDYRNRDNISNTAYYEGESTYPVIVEYSSDNVKYDYKTGKIEVTAVGECKVSVKVPVSRDENKIVHYDTYSFDVVVERYITEVTLKGSAGGINLKTGETGEFVLDISPQKHTVDAPTLNVSGDILVLDGTRYTAIGTGECSLTLTYETGIGVFYTKEYKVRIYDQPTSLNLEILDNGMNVDGDLEVGKKYKLIVSADCNLGNFTSLLVNSADPATLDYITLSESNLVDGKVEYSFTVSKETSINFQVGYYKQTYADTLTCIDALLTKNVVLP